LWARLKISKIIPIFRLGFLWHDVSYGWKRTKPFYKGEIMGSLERRLTACGIDINLYRTAVEFFSRKGFQLAFGGRGKYRGKFHLSIMRGGSWRCVSVDDVTTITDEPYSTMQQLLSM
jgi:hypothetical protein